MRNIRDRNTVLTQSELEALKVTQEVIKRMADNSSKTKTAFIALSVAVLTFSQGRMPPNFVLLGYLVFVVAFWYTDAKYLQLERAFRSHYNAIVDGSIPYLDMWSFKVGALLERQTRIAGIMLTNFTMWIYWISAICVVCCFSGIRCYLPAL